MGELLTSTFLKTTTENYSTTANNNATTIKTSSSENNFGDYYNKTIKNNQKDYNEETNYNNQKNENYEKNDESSKNISNKKTDNKENVKEKTVEDDTETKTKDEVKEEIANILASLLGISVEQVQQFMENNNLTLENVKEFIMTELQLENPAELLNIENIGSALKEISSLLEGLDLTSEEAKSFEDILSLIEEQNTEEVEVKNTDTEELNVEVTKNADSEKNNLDVEVEVENDTQQKVATALITEDTVETETDTDVETEEDTEVVSVNLETENSENGENSQFDQSDDFLNFGNSENTDENILVNSQQQKIDVSSTNTFSRIASQKFANLNQQGQDVMNQLVEKLKANFNPSYNEIKIQLSPENLGDVTVKVITENGIVTAQFIAENEKVKEIIESNFSHLSDTLKAKGLNVSDLSVSVGQDNQSSDEQLGHYKKEQSKSSGRVSQILGDNYEEEIVENIDYMDEDGLVKSTVSYRA